MKKTVLFLMVALMLCQSCVFASDTVTMYALDGRTASVPAEDVQAYIDAVSGVIEEMSTSNTDQQLADVINSAKTLLENRGETLLEEQDKTNYAVTINEAINTEFDGREELKNALISLFDVA